MPDDAAALAAKLAALPAALVEATPRAVRAGAEVLEDAVRVNVAQATGGDMRLSRVRSGRGARIDVDTDVVGAGSRAQARVTPTGPIMLVEEDTDPHRQPFVYSGTTGEGGRRRYAMRGELLSDRGNLAGLRATRGRRERRGFLFIPGVGFRARARHPGTEGKHPVRDAFAQSGDDAGRAGALVFQHAVRKVLT
jgi:hypothetical protein